MVMKMNYENRRDLILFMWSLATIGFLLFTLVAGLSSLCLFVAISYMILIWVLVENLGRGDKYEY